MTQQYLYAYNDQTDCFTSKQNDRKQSFVSPHPGISFEKGFVWLMTLVNFTVTLWLRLIIRIRSMIVGELSLTLFADFTQYIRMCRWRRIEEGKVCAAATVLSSVCSVRLTARSCSLQQFTHKNYIKKNKKIVLDDICTVLGLFCNSLMLFWCYKRFLQRLMIISSVTIQSGLLFQDWEGETSMKY